jgi:hypothetical protein
MSTNDKVQLRVQSSIVQYPNDGLYGVVLHWEDGTILVGPVGEFATVEEAKAAGSAILTRGMELLRQQGFTARRPQPGE